MIELNFLFCVRATKKRVKWIRNDFINISIVLVGHGICNERQDDDDQTC